MPEAAVNPRGEGPTAVVACRFKFSAPLLLRRDTCPAVAMRIHYRLAPVRDCSKVLRWPWWWKVKRDVGMRGGIDS